MPTSLLAALVLAATVPTQPSSGAEPEAVRGFVQVGVGMVEVAHFEVGGFVTRHLSVEAMAAWTGVFGGRYGGGVFYAFGSTPTNRPPRHAFLLGARLMLDSRFSFDSHGDDLSSYLLLPVGYAFLGDAFYLRATIGPAITRSRSGTDADGTTKHQFEIGGASVNLGFGLAF